MVVLVLNAGSSSLKYTLFSDTLMVITKGIIEEIKDYKKGFEDVINDVKEHISNLSEIHSIVHRVVHGGEYFSVPTRINKEVIEKIESLIPLAPLHNRANLEGIKASFELSSQIPQVAVFDTAFHQSMPEYAYRYALPQEYYEDFGIRRYGFHGSSHEYISTKAAKLLNKPLDKLNIISFHIGNGASACAIEKGKSIDTSMGMTPLEGLMMGTRSGSIDPAIIFYLMKEHNLTQEEIESALNKKSGLLGMAQSSDMRLVIQKAQEGDTASILALDMYTYRLKKQLGAYMASMKGLDAVVFTGGIGEHSAFVREKTCKNLEHLGIYLDKDKNSKDELRIHTKQSRISLLVIPTDEEVQMALHAKALF